MKRAPRIGESIELDYLVEPQHTIDFAEPPMPAVLSTPQLIGFMERTARMLLVPMLDDGESSVGVQVDIEHLAATLPGATVTCSARVVLVDRTLVTFKVEAREGNQPIARGLHRRRVINVQRFAQRLASRPS